MEQKILNIDAVRGIFHLMFFSGSPGTGQTWFFSALISLLILVFFPPFLIFLFLAPAVESKLPVVLEACCASCAYALYTYVHTHLSM